MTLMKGIISNIMILLGDTLCQWIVANVNLHTDIALDLLRIIVSFREDHPAVYPLSDIEAHETIATIMQYTQQLYFCPQSCNLNYFDQQSNWSYGSMMTAMYRIWTSQTAHLGITLDIHFDTLIGPTVDILRQWNAMKQLHEVHKTCLRQTSRLRLYRQWSYIPQNIRMYMWMEFHEVDHIGNLDEWL